MKLTDLGEKLFLIYSFFVLITVNNTSFKVDVAFCYFRTEVSCCPTQSRNPCNVFLFVCFAFFSYSFLWTIVIKQEKSVFIYLQCFPNRKCKTKTTRYWIASQIPPQSRSILPHCCFLIYCKKRSEKVISLHFHVLHWKDELKKEKQVHKWFLKVEINTNLRSIL